MTLCKTKPSLSTHVSKVWQTPFSLDAYLLLLYLLLLVVVLWLSLGQLKHDKEIQEMHLKKKNKIKLKWESLKGKKRKKESTVWIRDLL